MPCNQRHCKENSLKRGGQMANPLLQHYIKLTEFLGQALGPDYEVALHDMTDKKPLHSSHRQQSHQRPGRSVHRLPMWRSKS